MREREGYLRSVSRRVRGGDKKVKCIANELHYYSNRISNGHGGGGLNNNSILDYSSGPLGQ